MTVRLYVQLTHRAGRAHLRLRRREEAAGRGKIPAGTGRRGSRPPQSIALEHRELHETLARASSEGAAIGRAAGELERALAPHFKREEQFATPPLGLLPDLALGRPTVAMRAVLPMSEALEARCRRMLREHEAIRRAATRFRAPAERSGREEFAVSLMILLPMPGRKRKYSTHSHFGRTICRRRKPRPAKVACFTGASSGIGRATARLFGGNVGTSRSSRTLMLPRGAAAAAEMEASGIECVFIHCDVANEQSVKDLFVEIRKRFGGLDVAFNNAGIARPASPDA